MKKRILLLLSVFLYFTMLFLIGKIAFMLVNGSMSASSIQTHDYFEVLCHGLQLDLSTSGYLSIIPALLTIASVWVNKKLIGTIFNIYFVLILFIVTVIGVADILLFPHWGYHFDSSVFLYLKNPKEVIASATAFEGGAAFTLIVLLTFIFYIGYRYAIGLQVKNLTMPKSLFKTCLVLLVISAALFLPIRGGITVSTMNVGKAYYSDNMFLNYAAVNPQFNLFYSFSKSEDFGSQYQFFDKEKADSIFSELNSQPACNNLPQLLKTDRPNIILFLLESFSASVVEATGGDADMSPNLSRLAKEGILFSNFYANSFRTDRGMVSVLSGYPAHPTVAMMKYPQKTRSLPSIPASLKKSGYNNLAFYYGGDADFANMRSYIVGCCNISNIVSDKDFPVDQRMTKWGAPDHFLFEKLYNDLTEKNPTEPFFNLVLTLSSHEPFDVPTDKYKEPFLNAVTYTDSCIGQFVDKLKATDLWNNTLLIFVADHCMQSYPAGIESNDPKRFHIPLIWAGGAVAKQGVISADGSQNDLAATLLSQLKIGHKDFVFSKDMINPKANKFAFYSYVNGFTMINSTGIVTYDNDKNAVIRAEGDTTLLTDKAKAFFQKMYMDLGNR